MSNYTIVTNFVGKDSLVSGNPAKAVKGADFTTEFTAVQTAINSKVDGTNQYFPDGTVAQPSVGFTNSAGTGMFQSAGTLEFATVGTLRASVNTTGNWVIPAASSGSSLSVSATGTSSAAAFSNSTSGSSSSVLLSATNTVDADFSVTLSQAGAASKFTTIGTSQANPLNLSTSGASRVVISSAGNVTINDVSSGSNLSVGTTSGTTSQLQINTSSTGTSALIVNSNGTQAAEFAFNNSGSATPYGIASGDTGIHTLTATGNLTLGTNAVARVQITPSGNVNVPNGSGSLSPVYAGVPVNLQSSSYTLVLADANKCIFSGTASAITVTIPSNASVPFPIGTVLTFVDTLGGGVMTIAINSDNLIWSANGSTGSRTLLGAGMATAIKVNATTWYISGSQIS